ncbi:hypothetical protein I4U23_003605 [Adineta vaga]|nr:hypothetical protein I4U23_003605 [Adineta vaga]
MWDSHVTQLQKVIEIFNSDNPIYGGSGLYQNENVKVMYHHGRATLFRLAIPPLSTLVLEEYLN